jgi:hypothetical protein
VCEKLLVWVCTPRHIHAHTHTRLGWACTNTRPTSAPKQSMYSTNKHTQTHTYTHQHTAVCWGLMTVVYSAFMSCSIKRQYVRPYLEFSVCISECKEKCHNMLRNLRTCLAKENDKSNTMNKLTKQKFPLLVVCLGLIVKTNEVAQLYDRTQFWNDCCCLEKLCRVMRWCRRTGFVCESGFPFVDGCSVVEITCKFEHVQARKMSQSEQNARLALHAYDVRWKFGMLLYCHRLPTKHHLARETAPEFCHWMKHV